VKDILSYYLEKVEHDETVTVEKCGLDCIGQQPAKIAEAVNRAVSIAYARGARRISYLDWRRALSEETLGLRQPVPWSQRDRARLAIHEAGHAVAVFRLFKGEYSITLASIVRYGKTLGHISHIPCEQLYIRSEDELRRAVMVSLAGRAAEEVFLGEKMASLAGDMKHLNHLTRLMVSQGFFQHLPNPDGSWSESLQKEVEGFISRQLNLVKGLLSENAPLVQKLSERLQEKEEILGPEVLRIFEEAAYDLN